MMIAMIYNASEAREHFPRMLEVAEMDESLRNIIISLSKRVPCWMFLRWVSQMLAEIGSISNLGTTVMPILEVKFV